MEDNRNVGFWHKVGRFFTKNIGYKLLSITLAFLIWIFI